MPAPVSRNLSISRKNVVGLALFLGALLLILRVVQLRNQPERLMTYESDIMSNAGYKISGDTLVVLAGTSIQIRSLHGTARRTLLIADPGFQFCPGILDIVAGKVVYAVEPVPKETPETQRPKAVLTKPAPPKQLPEKSLGLFRMQADNPSSQRAAEQERGPLLTVPLTTQEVRFRQIAIQGGTPLDIITLKGNDFHLIGDHVFWSQAKRGDTYRVVHGKGARKGTSWLEDAGDGDLMLTSLTDKTTHCLRSGILRQTSLYFGQSGVEWEELGIFPNKPTNFYARVADGSVHTIHDSTPSAFSLTTSVEYGGRIYWVGLLPKSYTANQYRLMSASPDFTDIREAFSQHAGHTIDSLLLYVYRGSLYCCLTEAPTITRHDVIRRKHLCRIHPERSDPIEIVAEVPDKSQDARFEGGYLYFETMEQKRSLWSTLTNDEVGVDVTASLCRIPIDR